MMRGQLIFPAHVAACLSICVGCLAGDAPRPEADEKLKRSADRMVRAGKGVLAPVYAPLARQIVEDFKLAKKTGVGIDLGSGPGTLIVELCKLTRMHWINADINPNFFAGFFRLAEANGAGNRVSAILADAQNLPFRDNYADVIVSRGSFHFWADRKKGFAEVYRVLKPGGVAYIGRGFARDMPVEAARAIRAKQGKALKYDRREQAKALGEMMRQLGIRGYGIHVPTPRGAADVNYGIWVEFHKPAAAEK